MAKSKTINEAIRAVKIGVVDYEWTIDHLEDLIELRGAIDEAVDLSMQKFKTRVLRAERLRSTRRVQKLKKAS